jgi:hypothetical protein
MASATKRRGGKKASRGKRVMVSHIPAAKAKNNVAPGEPDLRKDEEALQIKYPTRHIVPGSLMPSGGEFGAKRSVAIKCQVCGKERRIATSDLFQVSTCGPECKKAAKVKQEGAKGKAVKA